MPMLIKLHSSIDGKEFYVNMDLIVSVQRRGGDNTGEETILIDISDSDGSYFLVIETPEQIMELIDSEKRRHLTLVDYFSHPEKY